ncbi:hypothetical protein GCM10022251_23950 [Phytohabitans flavus]|uniref:Selenocysteine-specific elongation factor n=1 Tax=Phytohabitans flavus TaxID=1076124 RepID=A0A6F8XRN8_9ACTN|nr:selenocysteine-specific translation elongation factor [Phytohabitans flavus]BCB76411.1 hypothetical protein Pflav_028210 [Phytohabitans flavus]
MYVVATAGHVDHGKSTLVRALTGMEPDRWAEERRRGMTIDLGFAWTTLPAGDQLAFVDVPGHERFVPNMLAGVGPVPAALLVVAADEGWMPQTAEHVAALDALGVRYAVLAVTRSDLADPGPVLRAVRDRLAGTTLAGLAGVPVSAPTGQGLDELRAALSDLVGGLPVPDTSAPVRLWVDRSFAIRGSGTVVTGTLGAGVLRTGDTLLLHTAGHGDRPVRIRGLQSLGRPADQVPAVARVAVNLRGVDRAAVRRGDALLTPSGWTASALVDVRVDGDLAGAASALVLHLGSAAVPVRVRPLGGAMARLTLDHPVPVAAGDVALLRDPGRHQGVGRVTVLDTDPMPLARASSRPPPVPASWPGPRTGHRTRRRCCVAGASCGSWSCAPPGPAGRPRRSSPATGLSIRRLPSGSGPGSPGPSPSTAGTCRSRPARPSSRCAPCSAYPIGRSYRPWWRPRSRCGTGGLST